MYEEGGGFTFELGEWTGRDGCYNRIGQVLDDVPRAMASLRAHGLLAIVGEGGYVKLFSPAPRCETLRPS